MADTVIREVAKDVWIFSKPFARFGLVPVGGRSTAVKLAEGDVWVLASTPLNTETKTKIDELGPVKYIVGPDSVHYLFLREFKKAYPQAKLIGVETLLKKNELADLKFDGAYGADPEGTKYGFENEIKACYFSGFQNKDVAFFHEPSKSLIEADLLFNLPCKEQYSKTNSSGKIPIFSNINPFGWAHKRFVWDAGRDKVAMRRDAKTVAGWNFTRVIPCHGDVIETDGNKAWREAYKWFLD
ncbi:hypothetical protein BD410DRAFT_789034 [Rickenella mellea]|uniref:DUF4336 domain-containing protein n=1 Tax=Rickenella mellea TaxID=50990 RepID=A0A4Y7Q457_9AGAM|nr:hypothetical protein BD410DRAFT_789034 [Rickenella mellea]